MFPLRDVTPQRRIITTLVKNWGDHKPDLKIDFNNHCAYCHSYDGFRHTWFEVDHFVPKVFFAPLGNISLTQYDNLVYSCKFCNNNKHNKWPSKSETIFNNGIEGFEDPGTQLYESHFYRTTNGAIMWKTPLGKWMYTEAFKFDQRERGIRLLWNLNQLRITIKKLDPIVSNLTPSDPNYLRLYSQLSRFAIEYFRYHDQLIEYYSSL